MPVFDLSELEEDEDRVEDLHFSSDDENTH